MEVLTDEARARLAQLGRVEVARRLRVYLESVGLATQWREVHDGAKRQDASDTDVWAFVDLLKALESAPAEVRELIGFLAEGE